MRLLLLSLLAAMLAVPAQAQLSGTYTVGGTSPDYAGIPAAVADLVAQGVSGDVIFQIRPGTYTPGTALDLGPISGASAAARVRFEASDPSDPPVLSRAGATGADNYVVRLDGADWVTLKNLTFVAAAPAPIGRLVVLTGGASNVTIRGCTFTGLETPGSDEGTLLWSDSSHADVTIDGNTFDGGWKGVEVDSFGSTGFAITENTFSGQEREGIDVRADGRVEGNTLTDAPTSSSSYRAIVTSGGPTSAMEVVGNTIEVQTGVAGIDGNGGPTLIANNLVSLRVSSPSGRGIYSTGGLVAHNTVRAIGESAALLLPVGAGVDVEIRNNILVVNGVGPAIRDESDNSILASNHNLLYSNTGALVEWESASYTTLAAWQAASGFDGASVSQTTDFVEVGSGAASWDLHLDGASLTDLSLIAPPLAEVTTDADGDARDPYNPKRGADEGTPLPPLDNADAPSGFYAVAGSSPDFADPAEAFDVLKVRGMKGPVTFRIRPGTFTFRESLPTTIRVGPAASNPASALLAIRGANPSNKPVLVSDAASGTNWALRLRGLDHVELNNLVFDASAAGDFGRILDLDEGEDGLGADDVTILNSSFIGGASGVASDERALIWSDTETHDRLSITGSTFTDGWAGLYITDSAAGSDMSDVEISGSSFTGQSRYGFLLILDADATISGNTFTSSAGNGRAVHLGGSAGYAITGNQISYTGTTSDGLYLIGTSPGTTGALVANNFVRADQPFTSNSNARDARLIHNSLYASGTLGQAVTTQSNPSISIAEMTNNILRSATSDPVLVLAEAEDLAASDGNVLHTNGGTLVESEGATYADLAAWQTASGLDAHSRSFSVSFQNAGQGNLHLGATSDGDPRLAGLPGTGITTDFDGEARNADNPTIGADEATPLLPLAGTYDVGTPLPGQPAADYATLQEALDTAELLGISASTTLRFYNDFGGFPVTVRPFDGGSATDRLVILPYNAGDTFAYSPTDAAANGAFRIDGADHVTLGYMTLDLSGGTGGHGQAVRLDGEVDDLHLELLGAFGVTGSASSEAALIGGASATTTDLSVAQSYFSDGAYGLYLTGGGSGTTVTNSDILGARVAGIRLIEHDGVTVSDVEITSAQSNADGIVLENGQGAAIDRARILLTSTAGLASYAINLNGQSGTPATPVSITNSFLTGGDMGVVILDVDHARIAHNTIRAFDAAAPGVFRSAGANSTNIQVVNNILVHEGGGRVLSVDDGGEFTELGPNDLVTTGAVLVSWNGTDYADLAAYQAGTSFGTNSVSVPVTFADAAAGDLHLAGASDGDDALGALPLADVTDDIDGDDRSTEWTYLGADEADTPLTPPVVVSYAVSKPAPLGAFAHGSAVNVAWTTLDPALEAGPVRISVLCPGQAPFVRYASTPNDGQAGFAVPVSLGTHGGIDDQANGCTVEVASVADPSRAAVSAPFVVMADAVGGVTTRKLDLATGFNPARYGLQDVIKWFWDETTIPTGNVRLSLVCDGRARFVRYASTANDGQASATLPATFGAYDVCRTEVMSIADPAFFGRSAPFEVLDTPLPSIDVLTPADGEAIVMGADYDITWETVGVAAGNAIRILLVNLTDGPPNRLVAQTTNTGTYTWSVPTDLDPTAEYRLSVKATADDGTFPVALIDPLTFVTALTASAGASAESLPEVLEVQSARPNPTRGRASLRVGVPESGPVEVAVYDAVGRRVAVLASGERSAGWYDLAVEAGDLAPGVYVVRALAGGTVATRTLTVVR